MEFEEEVSVPLVVQQEEEMCEDKKPRPSFRFRLSEIARINVAADDKLASKLKALKGTLKTAKILRNGNPLHRVSLARTKEVPGFRWSKRAVFALRTRPSCVQSPERNASTQEKQHSIRQMWKRVWATKDTDSKEICSFNGEFLREAQARRQKAMEERQVPKKYFEQDRDAGTITVRLPQREPLVFSKPFFGIPAEFGDLVEKIKASPERVPLEKCALTKWYCELNRRYFVSTLQESNDKYAPNAMVTKSMEDSVTAATKAKLSTCFSSDYADFKPGFGWIRFDREETCQ